MNIQFSYRSRLAIKIILLLLVVIIVRMFLVHPSGGLDALSPNKKAIANPDDLPLCSESTPNSDEVTKPTPVPNIDATSSCRLHTTIHEVSSPVGRSMPVGEVLRMTQEAISTKQVTPIPTP